jgi:hypothetical protein
MTLFPERVLLVRLFPLLPAVFSSQLLSDQLVASASALDSTTFAIVIRLVDRSLELRSSARLAEKNRNRVIYGIFYPNVLMSLHPDYLLLILINPISPKESKLECFYYSYQESNILRGVKFWDEVNQEDKDICERNQKGHTLFHYDQNSKYFSNLENFCKVFYKLIENDLLTEPLP